MELRAPQALTTSVAGSSKLWKETEIGPSYVLGKRYIMQLAINVHSLFPPHHHSSREIFESLLLTFQSSHTQINQHLCWLQNSQHKLILQPHTHQASCCHLFGNKQRSESHVLIPHHWVPQVCSLLGPGSKPMSSAANTELIVLVATWSVDVLLALTQNTVLPKDLQAGVNESDYHITNTSRSSSVQKLCSTFLTTIIRQLILQCIDSIQPVAQGHLGILGWFYKG